AIGHGEEYHDESQGDAIEAEALYRLLENDVIPLFYKRDEAGVPHGWVARMKRSIATVGPLFNTARMVEEYARTLYDPAACRTLVGSRGVQHPGSPGCRARARPPDMRLEGADPFSLAGGQDRVGGRARGAARPRGRPADRDGRREPGYPHAGRRRRRGLPRAA